MLIRYRSPGHFDEAIAVRVRPAELRRSSFRMQFEMRGEDDRLVAEGYGVLVGYDYVAGRAEPLSDELVAVLEAAAPAEDGRASR